MRGGTGLQARYLTGDHVENSVLHRQAPTTGSKVEDEGREAVLLVAIRTAQSDRPHPRRFHCLLASHRVLEDLSPPRLVLVFRPGLFAPGPVLLQGVLELGVPLDPDHVVYEALARMAGEHPREVIEVMRLMIVTDPEGWSVLGSVDEVRQTLATVLDSGDEAASSNAIVVLHLLGAKGMTEFRDLMPEAG
jgi:hypothetical protein